MFSIRFSWLMPRTLLLLVLLVTLAGPTVPGAPGALPGEDGAGHAARARPAAGDYSPGRVIVKLDSSSEGSNALALLQTRRLALGLGQMRELVPGTGEYLLSATAAAVDVPAAAAVLASIPGVRYATPDYLLSANRVPNDTHYAEHQWYMRTIRAEAAWDITTGSEGVIIADVDTGVARDHPDLRSKLLPGFNAIRGDGSFDDDNGHGTATSGLFGAETNNDNGIAGLCWSCKILPVKILNSQGGGSVSSFAVGIRWAVDNGARVLNISAGVDFEVPTMEEAVKYARSRNVVVVASAGNTPDGNPRFPAGYGDAIAVGATAGNDTTTGFSSYGPYVDLSAPGVGILSTSWDPDRGVGYDFANGTSFSAPLVAGAVGLMLSLNPNLTPEQVQAVLVSSADDIETPGWDDRSGWGRLNVQRALQMVQSGNIPPLPQVPAAGTRPSTDPADVGGSIIRGRVVGISPVQAQVFLAPDRTDLAPRTANLSDDGFYSFENLPAGRYTVGLLVRSGLTAPPSVVAEVDGQGATVREVNFTVGDPAGAAVVGGFADAAFRRLWERTDQPVASGMAQRSWMWGPNPGLTTNEQYAEGAGGTRKVQYFDKSRMEINNPAADANSQFYVTNGLLTRELIRGRIQIGNSSHIEVGAANIPLASDGDDPNAPTYASFAPLLDTPGQSMVGRKLNQVIGRGGQVSTDDRYAQYPGSEIAYFEPATGRNIPAIFWNFVNATGPIQVEGQITSGKISEPWFFATGLPIAEAYWANVKIEGQQRDVLIQPFERRVLTYVPSFAPEWQVQMGNIGRHYYDWRYNGRGRGGAAPIGGPAPGPGTPGPGDTSVPPSVNGSITPPAAEAGTIFRINIHGFRPNESVAYWITDPTQAVYGPESRLNVGGDGSATLSFRSPFDMEPGVWAFTFHGVDSRHQSIIYFRILPGE